MKYYLDVMKKYADFTGRARRKEYWMFVLFQLLFGFVAGFLDGLLFGSIVEAYFVGPISSLYVLATILPSLAVLVRRLHDVGKSGWFYFVSLIPIIGYIWLLVLLCTNGVSGPNQYGPDPKADARPNLVPAGTV